MLKAAVRSPCRSGRAVCFHTANGFILCPRRQISTTAKPDTLAQLSLEGRNETNRISVDLPKQR